MSRKVTMDEGVAILNEVCENTDEDVYVATVRSAKKFSKDPIFNLATYLKFTYGPLYSGENEEGFITMAKVCKKFFVTKKETV